MPIPMRLDTRWAVWATTGVALALIAWAYWPGLSGPFVFDDYANLDVLGAYGHALRWPNFLFYITSGAADPTGRPVALLSFLLDADSWPADPWPFKRTNLALHLINTALLAWTTAILQARLQRRRPQLAVSRWTPALAAALWGAHPFFVSTTWYVVQREAMLPMTFVLLAVLAWDRAVQCFGHGRSGRGWIWAILGMGGATLLAGLSKANGFLAPMLVGLAYVYFLRPNLSSPSVGRRPMDTAAVLCLALPSLLVLLYLVHVGWQAWSLPYLTGRDWTLPERLLSQPRALWDYVLRLAVPRAGGGGVYVEGFPASRGWMDPVTTMPAMLALGASVVAAVAFRRSYPIASFAWLFFLAAHLLESSTVALELYFEHRNYMPAAFLGWPLAHALLRPGGYVRSRLVLAAVILAGLLLLTHQRALVWGDEALLNALSAAGQEDSLRSQVAAARGEFERGQVRTALSRIHTMQSRHPASVDLAVNAIGFECEATRALAAGTLKRANQALTSARNWNYGLYVWLQGAARETGLRNCRGFGLEGLKTLVASAESNPVSAAPARKRDLWHVRGRIALAEGRPDVALRWFNAALVLKPDPEYALVQAAALGDAGAQALGVRHLDHYASLQAQQPPIKVRDMPTAHAWLLWHYGYYHKQLSHLRGRLQLDAGEAARARMTP